MVKYEQMFVTHILTLLDLLDQHHSDKSLLDDCMIYNTVDNHTQCDIGCTVLRGIGRLQFLVGFKRRIT